MKKLLAALAGGFSVILLILVATVQGAVWGTAWGQDDVRLIGLDDQPQLAEYLHEEVERRLDSLREDEQINIYRLKDTLKQALHAKGYYNAQIVQSDANSLELAITPGEPYHINTVTIKGIDGHETDLKEGEILLAQRVLDAQKSLLERIDADHCFFSLSITHGIILDHLKQRANIIFTVSKGPESTFGDVQFHGMDHIDESYLRRYIKFQPGQCWRYSKIESSKNALVKTGLITTVTEKLPAQPKADGSVDVIFKITERKRRSVRLGASYYTDDGPGITAGWVHRNLFGHGEELSANLEFNFEDQKLTSKFKKPFFLRDDQHFSFGATAQRNDTDAFEAYTLTLAPQITRELGAYLSADVGLKSEMIYADEDGGPDDTFWLLSTVGALSYDDRDNKLDPHSGFYIRGESAPYIDLLGEADPFLKTEVKARTYFSFSDQFDVATRIDPVLAVKGRIGTIIGDGVNGIPATHRFYAGGSDSIRGFGSQEAGPFVNGDPVGGRSILETSAEMRMKFTETIGGVAFIDGGNVYDEMAPNFGDGYFLGAGVGARYYTGFGPLRLDVAVPLNHGHQADEAFQVYISIGQAF